MSNGTAYTQTVQCYVEQLCRASHALAQRQIAQQYMKYFDVVANRRACSWHDVKAISPKPPKVPTANETAIYWRHDVSNMVWSLRLTGFTSPCRKAEPIRNFSVSFSSFFPADIHIYSLSFMKALIEIATRLNSTTVFRPPGLPQFARVCQPECLQY